MYGAQTKLGIARQAAANSWVTAPASFHGLGFLSEDLGLTKAEVISQNLIGRFDQGASYGGIAQVNGTLQFEMTPRNIGAALAALFGPADVTVSSGSVQNYTFLPDTVDFSSTLCKYPFTVYKQFSDSNSAELFYDCQFSELMVQITQGQFAKGTLTLAGGTRLSTGIGSMSVLPAASDVGRLFPWNVTSLSWGGSGLSQISDLTIHINDSVQPVYTVNGTLAPFKFTRSGFREVTVDGTFYMNDRALLNDFVNETQRQLLVTLQNTKAAVQSGYFDTLFIDIPQLKLTQLKPGASGPGEVSVKFSGRGVLDPTSSYSIQFILTNTFAGGY